MTAGLFYVEGLYDGGVTIKRDGRVEGASSYLERSEAEARASYRTGRQAPPRGPGAVNGAIWRVTRAPFTTAVVEASRLVGELGARELELGYNEPDKDLGVALEGLLEGDVASVVPPGEVQWWARARFAGEAIIVEGVAPDAVVVELALDLRDRIQETTAAIIGLCRLSGAW